MHPNSRHPPPAPESVIPVGSRSSVFRGVDPRLQTRVGRAMMGPADGVKRFGIFTPWALGGRGKVVCKVLMRSWVGFRKLLARNMEKRWGGRCWGSWC